MELPMKNIFILLWILILHPLLSAQTVTGKLVDQMGSPLSGLQLQLYINTKVYTTSSGMDGSFTFSNITSVKNEQLPTGYSVTNNYPNPFNPTTRFEISVPGNARVSADIYNVLGEKVHAISDRVFHAGVNNLDIELNGLPNGFYVAQINIDGKYSVIKKIMLLYGSRHLHASPRISASMSGSTTILDIKIDSLVVTRVSGKTAFKNLPNLSGSSLNLGSLVIKIGVWSTELNTYVSEITHLQTSAEQNMEVWLGSMDSLAAVEKLRQYFLSNSNVDSVEVTPQGISVLYSNGIQGGVVLNTLDAPSGVRMFKSPGLSAGHNAPSVRSVVNNKKMIMFEGAYIDFPQFFESMVTNHTANLPRIGYTVENVFRGEAATLDRYTKLSGYGIIQLASHGVSTKWPPWKGGDVYMLTGDSVNAAMKYPIDLVNRNIAIFSYQKKNMYWINEKFILKYNDFSRDTVLFYGSFCFSHWGGWRSLQKKFAAGVYVGYDWIVDAVWDAKWANNMISMMSDSSKQPLPSILDWKNDPTLPKVNSIVNEVFDTHVMLTGDTTLTLLPDTSTTVKDIDGNVYHIKRIGTQVWMLENLKTTRLHDSTALGLVTDGTYWGAATGGVYCFYDNNPANKGDYGALYNWQAVNSGKLAPKNWHVPSIAEWNVLVNFLGGATVAGGKMKETGTAHWSSPNVEATNSSGFKGLPGGYRFIDGQFVNLRFFGAWWTTTGFDAANAHSFTLRKDYGNSENIQFSKSSGFSVRCIRN